MCDVLEAVVVGSVCTKQKEGKANHKVGEN